MHRGSKRKDDAAWKDTLTDAEFYVLREKGTEPAGSGAFNKFYPQPGEGYFACAGCESPLYSVSAKFDSGCGWPAFDKSFEGSVKVGAFSRLSHVRLSTL